MDGIILGILDQKQFIMEDPILSVDTMSTSSLYVTITNPNNTSVTAYYGHTNPPTETTSLEAGETKEVSVSETADGDYTMYVYFERGNKTSNTETEETSNIRIATPYLHPSYYGDITDTTIEVRIRNFPSSSNYDRSITTQARIVGPQSAATNWLDVITTINDNDAIYYTFTGLDPDTGHTIEVRNIGERYVTSLTDSRSFYTDEGNLEWVHVETTSSQVNGDIIDSVPSGDETSIKGYLDTNYPADDYSEGTIAVIETTDDYIYYVYEAQYE